jgi:hypothetical protein
MTVPLHCSVPPVLFRTKEIAEGLAPLRGFNPAYVGCGQLPHHSNEHVCDGRRMLRFGVRATDCLIKGNISSSGERIYHVPGQRYYDKR